MNRLSGFTAIVLTTALATSGCVRRPLVERAIRARGGPLVSLVREVEADVYQGFAGKWRWRTVFLAPDRYAWTIFTTGEPQHHLFDGARARSFIGPREVTLDASPAAPLRSHARFTAVVNLDALLLPGVYVAPIGLPDLPAGIATGLAVTLAEDGTSYRLGFDEATRLVWVAGPVSLPPLGEGELEARLSDFRRVHGLLLPFRIAYSFRGQRLADEQALAVFPNRPEVTEIMFRAPATLPGCGHS
jgi:hypothetical protein